MISQIFCFIDKSNNFSQVSLFDYTSCDLITFLSEDSDKTQNNIREFPFLHHDQILSAGFFSFDQLLKLIYFIAYNKEDFLIL